MPWTPATLPNKGFGEFLSSQKPSSTTARHTEENTVEDAPITPQRRSTIPPVSASEEGRHATPEEEPAEGVASSAEQEQEADLAQEEEEEQEQEQEQEQEEEQVFAAVAEDDAEEVAMEEPTKTDSMRLNEIYSTLGTQPALRNIKALTNIKAQIKTMLVEQGIPAKDHDAIAAYLAAAVFPVNTVSPTLKAALQEGPNHYALPSIFRAVEANSPLGVRMRALMTPPTYHIDRPSVEQLKEKRIRLSKKPTGNTTCGFYRHVERSRGCKK